MDIVGNLNGRMIVIGLGSPIMTDDAIGLKVAESVEAMNIDGVDTAQEAVGGLDIIPLLFGYRDAVIVDAIKTGACPPGTVILFDPEDFEPTVTNASAHEMNLATAIRIGRQAEPESMPRRIRFVAIEVSDIMTVSEKMTDAVESSLQNAVDAVTEIINEFQTSI